MRNPAHSPSHTRLIVGFILTVVTVPLLLLGLMDPMEGGMALLVAGAVILATWLVSRVPVPPLEWIAWAAAIAVGITADIIGTVLWNQGLTGPGLPVPWWMWILIGAYEVGAAATAGGGVWYLLRHVRALRHQRPEESPAKAVHA